MEVVYAVPVVVGMDEREPSDIAFEAKARPDEKCPAVIIHEPDIRPEIGKALDQTAAEQFYSLYK